MTSFQKENKEQTGDDSSYTPTAVSVKAKVLVSGKIDEVDCLQLSPPLQPPCSFQISAKQVDNEIGCL